MDNLKLVGGTVVGVAVVLVSTSCWCTQLLILVSSIIALRLYLAPKMRYCESTNRLDGRVVIVTGGNTGIGKETVIEMASRGAKVITGCRDLKKAESVVKIVKDKYKMDVVVEPLDLADLASVKKFAARCLKESRIDILVNNAGLMMPKHGAGTKQGLEMHFGVNYLGHYLLTSMLYPLMAKTGTQTRPSRLINVSSSGYQFTLWQGLDVDAPNFGYTSWAYTGRTAFHRMYGQSKLAQIYHAREVTRQAGDKRDNVVGYSLHPGAVNTEITRYHEEGLGQMFTKFVETMLSQVGRTPYQGAQTIFYCCLTDAGLLTPGGFYDDCQLVQDYRMINWYSNKEHQRKLEEVSKKMVAGFL